LSPKKAFKLETDTLWVELKLRCIQMRN